MFKIGDILIVTGERGHYIPVGRKVTVVEVDDNHGDRIYKVEDERGFRQWVFNDDLRSFSPPQKITQNGYEYSLVGPVKPEWLVDGAWVVNTETGEKRIVKEERPGVFNLCVDGLVSIRYYDGLRNQYRRHEPKDWKWGDWAMYGGKRVFVMEYKHIIDSVKISHPDLDDSGFACKYVFTHELTPTF